MWKDPEPARSEAGSRHASKRSLPSVGSVGFQGATATRSCGNDVVQVCRLAKTMQVPVAEMQRWYTLFRDHAEPLAPGAELLRHGRLGQEQFAKLVRSNLISDGDMLPKRSVERMKLSIKRALQAADVNQDRAVSFDEFLECMRILTFDEAFSVAPEERELRRIAKTYKLSLLEVDKYKKMFDELDENGSGRIKKPEFDQVLNRCGSIPRNIGLSASRRQSLWLLADPNLDGSIDLEEFVLFNFKYFAPGAEGLADCWFRR